MVGWIGPPCDLRLHFSPTRTSYFPMAVPSSILLLLLFSVNWFLKCMVFLVKIKGRVSVEALGLN